MPRFEISNWIARNRNFSLGQNGVAPILNWGRSQLGAQQGETTFGQFRFGLWAKRFGFTRIIMTCTVHDGRVIISIIDSLIENAIRTDSSAGLIYKPKPIHMTKLNLNLV